MFLLNLEAHVVLLHFTVGQPDCARKHLGTGIEGVRKRHAVGPEEAAPEEVLRQGVASRSRAISALQNRITIF